MSVKSSGHKGVGRAVPFALSISLLAAGCSSNAPTRPEAARPVKTMVVTAGGETHVRSFPGKVEASKKAELAFRVSGLLVKLPVKEGQRVAKGEVIAQLRQDEFQARLKALQGQLDKARAVLKAVRAGERPEQQLRLEAQVRAAAAKLANARTEYNRAAKLLRVKSIARADYDLAATAYQVAQEDHKAAVQMLEKGTSGREEDIEAMEGQVRGLEGRVVEAKIQLDDSTLRAPYDGVIAQRFVDQGQNIMASDRVVQFQDLEEVVIAVDVPEAVMAGEIQYADIEQMTAELSAAPGVEFPVRIREFAQVADPVTQTFLVRVAMEVPPNPRALPGMSATVTVRYRRASVLGERILIPVEAVSESSSGDQVAWVLGEDGAVTSRAVKLGAATGGMLEVTQGLAPGDRLVIAGVRFLRDGMKARDLGDALGVNRP